MAEILTSTAIATVKKKNNPENGLASISKDLPPENGRHHLPNGTNLKVSIDVCNNSSLSPLGFGKLLSAATIPTIAYQILNDNIVILTGDE